MSENTWKTFSLFAAAHFLPRNLQTLFCSAQGDARSGFMMQGLFIPPSAVLRDRALEYGSGNMQMNPQSTMFLNKGEW